VVAQLSTMVNELISESEAPTIEWEVVAIEGDPTVDLVFEANARRVDLIVLSSRRRPLGAAFFGSTAESICRDALSPVLVLHEDARNWEGVQWGELPVRRILAAQDFSPAGDAALAYAAMLAGEYQTELQVLHVIPENYPETPSGVEFIEQQLDEMVPSEAKLWCSVKPVVRMGTPAAEILAQANQGTTDLLCLGRHRGDGEWREIFGSNTDFVLRHAPCPVLVAPPTTYSVSATD
jgi:nucleotide-binding universal stress UspA family protein